MGPPSRRAEGVCKTRTGRGGGGLNDSGQMATKLNQSIPLREAQSPPNPRRRHTSNVIHSYKGKNPLPAPNATVQQAWDPGSGSSGRQTCSKRTESRLLSVSRTSSKWFTATALLWAKRWLIRMALPRTAPCLSNGSRVHCCVLGLLVAGWHGEGSPLVGAHRGGWHPLRFGRAAPTPTGPCDIYGAAGTPCIAAHSLVRALYGSYTGPLYQVRARLTWEEIGRGKGGGEFLGCFLTSESVTSGTDQ